MINLTLAFDLIKMSDFNGLKYRMRKVRLLIEMLISQKVLTKVNILYHVSDHNVQHQIKINLNLCRIFKGD